MKLIAYHPFAVLLACLTLPVTSFATINTFKRAATISYQQQTGSLSGSVKTLDGQPLAQVSVKLLNTSKGTTTDTQGHFNLTGLPLGEFTIEISYIGMKTQHTSVTITEGDRTDLKLALLPEDQELDQVLIKGATTPFIKAPTSYVARLPLTDLENPQVYASVSKTLMAEQLATSLDETLKNIPGAGVPIRFNQNRIVFRSRGFITQPKVRNGLTSFTQTYIDPVNLERIEMLKGPSATLFGSSVVSYGGLLNRVTKKPFDSFGGNISYSGGSYNLNRLTADVNTPINADKTLLFRLNTAVHRENSFQDAGFLNSFTLAPSFSYQISDRAKAYLDVEYNNDKGTSPIRFSPYTTGITSQNITDLNIPYDRSFANNNVFYTGTSLNLFLKLDYKLSENWISQTAIARTSSSFDGYTVQLKGRAATTLRPSITTGTYGYRSTDIQQNFIGNFKLGSLKNRLVVGVDYYNYYADRNVAQVNTGTVDFTQPLTTYYDTFNTSYIDSAAVGGSKTIRNQETQTYSAYASDVINLTDRFLAMLSLRVDHFKDTGTYNLISGKQTEGYEQTALSPKLGVVYQLLPHRLSAFGNYMNGFSNQSGSDKNDAGFKPEQANQWEGGLKFDVFHHKLTGSLSYYDIQVRDIVREDPDDSDYSIQDGTLTSKGLELNLTANPFKHFYIMAGYAYNDSKYTMADASVKGLRPAESGPEHLVNTWMRYAFSGSLKGFALGFGGNHGSSSYQTKTQDAAVVIPAYTTLDASLSYTTQHMIYALKANNLTDEHYWSYRLAPQKPRNFIASVKFLF
ncbi:TonB-dependent siderophore receptor [Leeuwenhoekiella polynyae]|uniref:Iron complex outermembrane receptor protein n=1 Tax=Leeuwenhoekiella polynyae TaxID=1550906 RepID=A0A4Q0NR42_9FLAO|nr:TonB-dependent receptor [Leeuwenhoekiella polynyae]RXG12112.1 iron complex outermembrane receptor protein [Leeuwenhoekiella polynyae]